MIDPLDDSTVITAAAAGVTIEHAPTPRQLPLVVLGGAAPLPPRVTSAAVERGTCGISRR